METSRGFNGYINFITNFEFKIRHTVKKPLFIFSLFIITASLLLSLKCASNNNQADAGNTPPPPQKAPVTSFLTEKQFNDLFPMRDKFYTYAAFAQAAKELGQVSVKITRRAVSVYQFIRTDKATGKSTTVRQDEDWNEDWAKKKPDSSYTIDYGNFCA